MNYFDNKEVIKNIIEYKHNNSKKAEYKLFLSFHHLATGFYYTTKLYAHDVAVSADDIIQECILSCFRSIDNFDINRKPFSYFTSVIRKTIYTYIKNSKTEQPVAIYNNIEYSIKEDNDIHLQVKNEFQLLYHITNNFIKLFHPNRQNFVRGLRQYINSFGFSKSKIAKEFIEFISVSYSSGSIEPSSNIYNSAIFP